MLAGYSESPLSIRKKLEMIVLRILCHGLTGCLFAFALGGPVRADFVTSITPATNTSPTGNGNLVSQSFTPANTNDKNNDYTGVGASNPNKVVLSLDVFKMHVPFEINFTTSNGPQAGGNKAAEYFFTVTLNNQLLNQRDIRSLDIEIVAGPGLLPLFDKPANPVPTAPAGFPYNELNPTTTIVRFGGLSGGGGTIAYGGSGIFTFSIDIPRTGAGLNLSNQSFSLQFTANPEPGSLALCGLLGAPALSLLRRRRKPVTTDLPDEAGLI